ncbi:MAG: benzoyl-CoA-dihydrodiol lyase [Deltaproteobacteria bacterium]|nr:benzoyl-CoA-dihydrodiol lyase [Deltaproteobacteria bacterium]
MSLKDAHDAPAPALAFETHPSRYKHWKLTFEGELARLTMSVQDHEPLRPGYELKLNSYDLGVDIELCDAVQRLRFEHPEVRTVILSGDKDRVFCAGANIHMLGASSHAFKVNFCKYTNETRLSMEDASQHSGQRWLAACNGTTAGGGYELAMACDEIVLIEDGSSAVSLPEVALLAVLPGTGGLTRLVDKRKVRRDHADVFSTLAEGIKGKRAVEWRLVDAIAPRSKFGDAVLARARALAARSPMPAGAKGLPLPALEPTVEDGGDTVRYRHVTLKVDRAARTAALTMAAPTGAQPDSAAAIAAAGAEQWSLRAFRELDDALLRLRFNHEQVGVVLLRTSGDPQAVLAADRGLHTAQAAGSWLAREIVLHMARVLRRLDLTARSFFAVIDGPESCFAGSLLELALAADRVYALDDSKRPAHLAVGPLSGGALPMSHGLTRLQARFMGEPGRVGDLLGSAEVMDVEAAQAAGLITVASDDIDFADELRIAVEERVAMSPDALTGMEASLRFPGPETADTKIFGRLSAWQNWIFTRGNATGEKGALTLYGKPERPVFDWRRT